MQYDYEMSNRSFESKNFSQQPVREESDKSSTLKLSSLDKLAGAEILKGCCTQGCCGGGIPVG